MNNGSLTAPALVRSLAWRAALAGGLAAAIVLLAVRTQLYATMVGVAGHRLIVCLDMARALARAARAADRFVEALGPEVIDVALPPELERSVGRWRATRAAQQQELDAGRALLDTVNAALLVIDAGGRVMYMNRAARAWAREPVERLEQIAALKGNAAMLVTMQPGAREIVRFADGEPVMWPARGIRRRVWPSNDSSPFNASRAISMPWRSRHGTTWRGCWRTR